MLGDVTRAHRDKNPSRNREVALRTAKSSGSFETSVRLRAASSLSLCVHLCCLPWPRSGTVKSGRGFGPRAHLAQGLGQRRHTLAARNLRRRLRGMGFDVPAFPCGRRVRRYSRYYEAGGSALNFLRALGRGSNPTWVRRATTGEGSIMKAMHCLSV